MLKYGVYQIEAGGLELFDEIHDDMEAIMGLPMKQLKIYLNNLLYKLLIENFCFLLYKSSSHNFL